MQGAAWLSLGRSRAIWHLSDQRLVQCLGALLRLADGLDLDPLQVVEGVRVTESGGAITLELRTRDEPRLAPRAIEQLSDLFETEFGRKVRSIAIRDT